MGDPVVVHLFHRDLRLADNRGFAEAVALARQLGAKVLPLFVFTPQQIDRNPLKSAPSVQFMVDSLEELAVTVKQAGGRMRFAHGDTVEVLEGLKNVVAVSEVADYTPFAKKRQAEIKDFCEKRGIQQLLTHDVYLTDPGSVLNGSKRTFQKFTPFYMAAKRLAVPRPEPAPRSVPWASASLRIPHSLTAPKTVLEGPRMQLVAEGGRTAGLKCLASVPADYEEAHDLVMAPTSKLSAHHHFGTVSIRESYWNAPLRGASLEAFRRQLYWRDFYGHIMNDFEGLYGVGPYEFQAPKDWRKGEKEIFTAWSKGETGVPFVDAGIREMLATGFMHNRARLVVASWLVKDKGVHWRWGERFFAKHLVDYDPAQNMMNWIWVASVLPFASAPFRRHDPARSAAKADPDGVYVEHWLHRS